MIRRILRAFVRGAALRRLRSDRSGAAALEFALIAPTLFVLIMGGVEFGRLLWTQSALQMSVAQAARCYAWQVSSCTTTSGTQSFAAGVAPQLGFSSSTFSASIKASTPTSTCQCSATECAYVSASYPYAFIAKGLFPFAPNLSANACYPVICPGDVCPATT